MNQTRQLETEATQAHKQGLRWEAFWPTVAEKVRQAEPHSRQRYRRLYLRLVSLVASGDCDGTESMDALMPWERDDMQTPAPVSDIQTQAKAETWVISSHPK